MEILSAETTGKITNRWCWPKITVVTPSFNQGEFIEETIKSVLGQNYPNLEYIIIDGGSTDDSVKIIEKYEKQLHYFVSEKDQGQSSAINKGFAHGTGEILAWLNSDDQFAPGALMAMAIAFQLNPEADLVAGVAQVFKKGKVIERHLTCCPDGPLNFNELLDIESRWTAGQFFYQPEVFFTRKIWQKSGGYVDENLHFSMDYDLWVRFAIHGAKLHVIGTQIALFRVHENQKTNFDKKNFLDELTQCRDNYRLKAPGQAVGSYTPPANKKTLRIALLNDIGYEYGAGIAHLRIGQVLVQAGHELAAFSAYHDCLPQDSESTPWTNPMLEAVIQWQPDIIVVGNVHNAKLVASDIEKLAKKIPVLLTLHDLWWLTGRCAYNADCQEYVKGCSINCPTAESYPALSPPLIPSAWEKKRHLISQHPNIRLLANSVWTEKMFKDGAMDMTGRIHRITYGINPDVFKPQNREELRRELGLPLDKFIILFSAANINDSRKGLIYLIEAIKILNNPNILPLCVGFGRGLDVTGIGHIHSTGYIRDPKIQAKYYAAADLFVSPSLEEALGQVFIEAALCGTPIIGFDVGGVPEVVIEGVTGLLAKKADAYSLAECIKRIKDDEVLRLKIQLVGPIYTQNTFSPEKAYHLIFPAIREVLSAKGINLPTKISLNLRGSPSIKLKTFWNTNSRLSGKKRRLFEKIAHYFSKVFLKKSV